MNSRSEEARARAGPLIDREDPRVGELAGQALAADGVTVRTGRSARTAGT